jgi:hypothetical protein
MHPAGLGGGIHSVSCHFSVVGNHTIREICVLSIDEVWFICHKMGKIMRKVVLAIGVLFASVAYALAQAPSPGASGPATGTGYPAGSIPLVAVVSSADTTSSVATLSAITGRLTYICGFSVSGLGATALTNVVITAASVVGNVAPSYAYSFPAGATVVAAPIGNAFAPCLPGSLVNSPISVTVPGAAGNTNTNVNAWGYAN